MKNLRTEALLTTVVALSIIVSPFAFNWNETHLYTPRWITGQNIGATGSII